MFFAVISWCFLFFSFGCWQVATTSIHFSLCVCCLAHLRCLTYVSFFLLLLFFPFLLSRISNWLLLLFMLLCLPCHVCFKNCGFSCMLFRLSKAVWLVHDMYLKIWNTFIKNRWYFWAFPVVVLYRITLTLLASLVQMYAQSIIEYALNRLQKMHCIFKSSTFIYTFAHIVGKKKSNYQSCRLHKRKICKQENYSKPSYNSIKLYFLAFFSSIFRFKIAEREGGDGSKGGKWKTNDIVMIRSRL